MKWPVAELCRLLKMPRSVYYASRYQRVDAERLELRAQLRALHQLSRGSAGSRTLSLLMRKNGYSIGRWLARILMQECGLLSRQPGRYLSVKYSNDKISSCEKISPHAWTVDRQLM
jgi:putative transposase